MTYQNTQPHQVLVRWHVLPERENVGMRWAFLICRLHEGEGLAVGDLSVEACGGGESGAGGERG